MHIMNPSVEMLESVILEDFPQTNGHYDHDQVKDFLSDCDNIVQALSQKLEDTDYTAAMESQALIQAPIAVLNSGAVVRDLVMRPSFVFTSEDDDMQYAVVEGNQAFSGTRFFTDSILAVQNVQSRFKDHVAV